MTGKYVINPIYKNPLVISFMDSLHTDFDHTGTIIFQNRRNTIKYFVLADGQILVVKRFNYKGLINACLRIFSKTKAHKAFENGMTLERADIATPAPFAYFEQRNGFLPFCSYYVSAFTADQSIKYLLEREEPDKKMIESFAALMVKMHTQGIVHHDLNLSNVLYHEEHGMYKLSVIDINRMTLKVPEKLTVAECKDDFFRWTGRLELFLKVAYSYAQQRGWNAEVFIRKLTIQKINHDKKWTRRKKLHSFFY